MMMTRSFRRLLLSIAIASASVTAEAQMLSAAEQSDLRAMTKARPMQRSAIDMRNAAQERFYRKQLALAHLDATAGARIDAAIAKAKSAGPAPVTQGLLTIADLSSSDWAQWTTDALGAAPGATVMVLTLGVYVNDQPVGQVMQSTVYDTPYTSVSAAGMLQSPVPGTPVTAVMTSFWQDKSGVPIFSTQSVTTTALPSSIAATAPNAPAAPILVCRRPCDAPPPKCSYSCSTGMNCKKTPPRTGTIMFPVTGSITYGGTIDQTSVTNGTWIVAPATGAASAASFKFASDPRTKIKGNVLRWKFDPAQFQWLPSPPDENAVYVFATGVTIGGKPVWTFINNLAKTSSKNTVAIPAMQIAAGRC